MYSRPTLTAVRAAPSLARCMTPSLSSQAVVGCGLLAARCRACAPGSITPPWLLGCCACRSLSSCRCLHTTATEDWGELRARVEQSRAAPQASAAPATAQSTRVRRRRWRRRPVLHGAGVGGIIDRLLVWQRACAGQEQGSRVRFAQAGLPTGACWPSLPPMSPSHRSCLLVLLSKSVAACNWALGMLHGPVEAALAPPPLTGVEWQVCRPTGALLCCPGIPEAPPTSQAPPWRLGRCGSHPLCPVAGWRPGAGEQHEAGCREASS